MKECEKYAALLDAFSEGDLFMEDMVQVQNHLMNCPHCQAYLENLMAMRAAFPTVEETEVPEGFADRVMAAVAEHPRAAAPVSPAPKAKKTPWRKALLPIAACCAVVILLGRTGIFGGSSKEAAVMAAKSTAEPQTEAVAEECAAEEPKAKESTAAGLTADAAEDAILEPAAAYDGAMGEPAPETEMVVNDSYSYTADMKSETVTIGGEEHVQVTVTTEETAEAAPEEAEPPLLRDGTEFLLTAEEAGDLLAGFTPAAETETEALYLLSARDYIALLTALPREVRQSAPANAAETMRVIVLK